MPYIYAVIPCPVPILYIYTKLFGDLGAIDGDIIYHYWYVVKSVVWPY